MARVEFEFRVSSLRVKHMAWRERASHCDLPACSKYSRSPWWHERANLFLIYTFPIHVSLLCFSVFEIIKHGESTKGIHSTNFTASYWLLEKSFFCASKRFAAFQVEQSPSEEIFMRFMVSTRNNNRPWKWFRSQISIFNQRMELSGSVGWTNGWCMRCFDRRRALWSNEEWGERRASNQSSCAINYLCGVVGWKGEARWNYGKPFSAQLNNLGMLGEGRSFQMERESITVQIKTYPKFNDGKIM